MDAEIITALDVPDKRKMGTLLDSLPEDLDWYKLGLELFCAEGPSVIAPLKERGKRIFLDLKLHDIPRTVGHAVQAAGKHGIGMLTLHASGGSEMLRSAVKAAKSLGDKRPALLAVTVLTSLDADDLTELGIEISPMEQVLRLGKMAVNAGVDGLVCSPREVGLLRDNLGPKPLLVTPGIRMLADAKGDQKRISTPAEAVRDGATHLVIGRSITQATDSKAAVETIRDNIAQV